MNDTGVVMVHTTCNSQAAAHALAGRLVTERLAACASVGSPVESIYPWEGRIEQEPEVPLTLKTTAARLPALTDRLVELHDYEVPEVLAVPVVSGHAPYLEWLREWVNG